MEDQLVSPEVAKLAKQVKFDWRCVNTIDIKTGYQSEDVDAELNEDKVIRHPTQTKLSRWLREVHNIDVVVDRVGAIQTPRKGWSTMIYTEKVTRFPWNLGNCHSLYEEALETGLEQALTLITVTDEKV